MNEIEANNVLSDNYHYINKLNKNRFSKKRIISFNRFVKQVTLLQWDDRFYRNHISYDEFIQICNKIIEIKIKVEEQLDVLSSFQGFPKLEKAIFGISMLIVVLLIAGSTILRKNLPIIIYSILICIAIIIVLSAITVFLLITKKPIFAQKGNSSRNELIDYIEELNDRFNVRNLKFVFDLQLMVLEVIKIDD